MPCTLAKRCNDALAKCRPSLEPLVYDSRVPRDKPAPGYGHSGSEAVDLRSERTTKGSKLG
jgi:hypothetical protein